MDSKTSLRNLMMALKWPPDPSSVDPALQTTFQALLDAYNGMSDDDRFKAQYAAWSACDPVHYPGAPEDALAAKKASSVKTAGKGALNVH
jgi:hypothetical protein